MTFFRLDIKKKLILVILTTTFFSLLAGFGIIIFREIRSMKADMVQHASVIAQVTGNNIISELAFNQSESARETLERLRELPHVRTAFVFDDKNHFFAEFIQSREDRVPLPDLLNTESRFEGGFLHFFSPIVYKSNNYGTIYLRVATTELDRKMRDYLLLAGGVLAGLLAVSWLLAVKLQKIISDPILHLAGVARKLSRGGDFNVRVEWRGGDEIGLLYGYFNDMLDEVQHRKEERDGVQGELRKAQGFLENVIESMPSLLIALDEDGRVTRWNRATERVTGVPPSDAFGKNALSLPFLGRYCDPAMTVMKTRKHLELFREYMDIGERRFCMNVSIYPVEGGWGTGAVIRADDISEIEKKEQQLRQAQKMETIGTLAGGLAHDFNNMLGGIIGTVSLLQFRIAAEGVPGREELEKQLAMIEESANRAADMVLQLLTLAKKQEVSQEPVDLSLAVAHVSKICASTFDKCIEIDVTPAGGPAMVSGDQTQIEQVVLNLCVNAQHSMTIMRGEGVPWGGRLAVALEHLDADAPFCGSHLEAEEGTAYWRLSVADSGVGIDSRHLAKIFDPFFTTKQKGEGTGLGLAMVYNIVQQHKGFIDVYSEVGEGSNFNIFLPAARSDRPFGPLEKPDAPPTGSGLVLVVDDEPVIRQIACDALELCGYRVIAAEDGQQAVDMFKERAGEIDLVLMDMIMPKMSGKESFQGMKLIDPDVRVILCSGFKMDERVEELMRMGVLSFVQKPYTLKKLAESVQSAMAGSDRASDSSPRPAGKVENRL